MFRHVGIFTHLPKIFGCMCMNSDAFRGVFQHVENFQMFWSENLVLARCFGSFVCAFRFFSVQVRISFRFFFFSHEGVCIVDAPPFFRLLCVVTVWLRPCFPRPSGLHNVGLSCYINAAVQALGASERAQEVLQQVCVNAEDAEFLRAL